MEYGRRGRGVGRGENPERKSIVKPGDFGLDTAGVIDIQKTKYEHLDIQVESIF